MKRAALHVPYIDTSPYTELRPDQAALMGRLAALYRLARGGSLVSPIVVLSAGSLLRKVMPAAELLALTSEIALEQELDRDDTARALLRAGYTRTTVVEDPGTFAVRGGVIDLFVPLYKQYQDTQAMPEYEQSLSNARLGEIFERRD